MTAPEVPRHRAPGLEHLKIGILFRLRSLQTSEYSGFQTQCCFGDSAQRLRSAALAPASCPFCTATSEQHFTLQRLRVRLHAMSVSSSPFAPTGISTRIARNTARSVFFVLQINGSAIGIKDISAELVHKRAPQTAEFSALLIGSPPEWTINPEDSLEATRNEF